ncbi:hypothetical protein [Flavobacterium filum]|nr:hypothetical protein [Flavobacterium filum]
MKSTTIIPQPKPAYIIGARPPSPGSPFILDIEIKSQIANVIETNANI